MADTKQAYVSPPTGVLEITVIRDAQPRVLINLDLGIPNFTVFSLKLPLVEDQPTAMSGLIAESIHVLLDEVASFMMSVEYEEEIIVQTYASVLACFKGMSAEADSSKEQDRAGADPIVKTFEGTFNLPMAFVNETQKRVVTAAQDKYKELVRLQNQYKKIFNDSHRLKLEQAGMALQRRTGKTPEEIAKQKEIQIELFDYEYEPIKKLFNDTAKHVGESAVLFDEMHKDMYHAFDRFDYAKKNMSVLDEAINKGMKDIATMFLDQVLGNIGAVIDILVALNKPDEVKQREFLDYATAAVKVNRSPKVRHLELTYDPAPKTTVNDAARVIRQYRNRSLKQQPKPLYVIVYDQMGRPSGTLALGPKFKNQLLQITQKRASVDFSPPQSFPSEEAMKSTMMTGIPKAISVGGMTYMPEGVAGPDMALYHGPQDYLVKFTDGRSAIFPGRPTFRNMRRLNFPVPRNRFKWTLLPPEEPPKPEDSIKTEEAPDATSGGTL